MAIGNFETRELVTVTVITTSIYVGGVFTVNRRGRTAGRHKRNASVGGYPKVLRWVRFGCSDDNISQGQAKISLEEMKSRTKSLF